MSITLEIGALLGALIIAIFGVFAYWNQRRIDRKHELTNQRRAIYVDFISGLVDAANGKPERHLRARIEALMVGSDDVLKALSLYNNIADKHEGTISTSSKDFLTALAAVTIAMRKDVFERTDLTEREYASLLPIRR